MSQNQDEKIPPVINQKQALIINVCNLVIRAASVVGTLYIMSKQIKNMPTFHRVEFVPGQNGRLVVNEYFHERLKNIRYATPDEEWEYSHKVLLERLNEMRLLK